MVTWKRGDGRRMHGGKTEKEREKKVEINAIKIAIGYFFGHVASPLATAIGISRFFGHPFRLSCSGEKRGHEDQLFFIAEQ